MERRGEGRKERHKKVTLNGGEGGGGRDL